MAHVESIPTEGDENRVSWYCTYCLVELGADDAVDRSLLGQPCDRCPKCGSNAISWEPWGGEIADGMYFPHDENGHRTVDYRDALPWGD